MRDAFLRGFRAFFGFYGDFDADIDFFVVVLSRQPRGTAWNSVAKDWAAVGHDIYVSAWKLNGFEKPALGDLEYGSARECNRRRQSSLQTSIAPRRAARAPRSPTADDSERATRG